MNGSQKVLGHRSFCQRQKLGLVQARLRALCLRIKFANRLDFIAEELDTHGTVRLGRIDIEDSTTTRELPGHLNQVHLRVTDAGQMRSKDFDIKLFTTTNRDSKACVV